MARAAQTPLPIGPFAAGDVMRRGGAGPAAGVGARPGPGNWVRRAAAVRWAPRRRDLGRGAAEPPSLRSSRSAERG